MLVSDGDRHRAALLAWSVYRRDFWRFAKYLVTQDEQRKLLRPFPVPADCYRFAGVNGDAVIWPHLAEYYERFRVRRLLPILKSRRMYATNGACGFIFHEAFFTDKTRSESYLAGISAQKERVAQKILARIRLMYQSLPEWMKLLNRLVVDNEHELVWSLGGRILAFSADPDAYRAEGFSRILADEFAFHPDSERALDSIMGTVTDGGRVVIASTPNGKSNGFYALVHGQMNPNIPVHKMHWREIPGRDDEWKAQLMREMFWTAERWAREMEHSFETCYGPTMFEEFRYDLNVRSLGYRLPDDLQAAYCAWDIGYEAPVALLAYSNRHNQLIPHLAIVGHRPKGGFGAFIKQVKEYRQNLFALDRWIDYAPHDVTRTSTGSGTTYLSMFEDEGIYPEICPRAGHDEGWELIRGLLTMRGDGLPGLIVNSDGLYLMEVEGGPPELRNILLEGFQGGFTRRQVHRPDGLHYLDQPNDIHPFIDVFDALNYLVRMRSHLGVYQEEESQLIYQPDI